MRITKQPETKYSMLTDYLEFAVVSQYTVIDF